MVNKTIPGRGAKNSQGGGQKQVLRRY